MPVRRALLTYPAVSLAACALILASLRPKADLSHCCGVRPLIYLGKISYGLYVFHLMFVELLDVSAQKGLVPRIARIVAALLCSAVTAAFSYHFLEKRPFLALEPEIHCRAFSSALRSRRAGAPALGTREACRRTGMAFAAGTKLLSAWCHRGMSGLHSG